MDRETLIGWFGEIRQLIGKDDSVVLAQLPLEHRPDPRPACATCPARDWYLTAKGVRCYCKEHRFVSWVSNENPVLICEARERLIEEDDA